MTASASASDPGGDRCGEDRRPALVQGVGRVINFAHVLKDLSDIHFPSAEKIVLVQDNLQAATALYEAFRRPRCAASSSASSGTTFERHRGNLKPTIAASAESLRAIG